MSSLKILIVDDDPEMVSSLSRVFEKDGLETLGALSATECLERLDKEPEVCAALVDLVMPGMDGITLLEEIKKKSSRAIPVFIMTGYGTIESAVEAVKKGAEVVGTEDPTLLLEEYRSLLQGSRKSALSGQVRLKKRDTFIAQRIHHSLKEGEIGILFMGLLHRVDKELPADIQVEFFLNHLRGK